ncbi:M12 family metallopeptidase [Aquimarina sp. AU119]|uniref:M12 family metallopeptidase n=1 Tax=Aquimarina sp. AU119 TaxID=2108528 RepID=UPI000D68A254|nr:M12 family metallopeptidase [Aquimarina sp. AU119]
MKTKTVLNGLKIGVLAIALSFISCEKNEEFDQSTDPTSQEEQTIEKFFLGERVRVKKENDGTFSLQGTDVRLFEDQLSDTAIPVSNTEEPTDEVNAKLGLGGGVRKWTNNTIVYVIQNGLNQFVRDELQKSMDEWTSKTNVRFKERTNESNYVTISSNGRNCNCGVATLGMNGSRGFIRLGSRTSAVVTIHEIGHTLGYIHEQNRSDRDNHIIINFNNIQDGAEDQFFKSNSATLITRDFDINSTMMYGSYTFSKNGQPTITDLNGNVLPRRRAAISPLDIQGTNNAYPGDGGGGGNPSVNPCEGIAAWVRGQSYSVGDKVTYRGFLYERDFTRWNRIAECTDTPVSADICEGVSEYNRNNNYSAGDKVTYNGFLYTLGSNGRWSNNGRCGA